MAFEPQKFPPRGGLNRDDETPPSRQWLPPSDLGAAWNHAPGKLLLGKEGARVLGFLDNRHIVTIAGSRAGKTSTLLIPNLLNYPGPAVVIDPKGELALATAAARQKMGQRVHILNPFPAGVLNFSSSHNPLAELEYSSPETLAADVAQIADALIIDNAKDSHWTDSAKNVLVGLILFALVYERERLNIRGLRALLSDDQLLMEAWRTMADSDAFDGRLRNIGKTFLGKIARDHEGNPVEFDGELRSILSTAREQTRPLDDVAHVTEKSDFRLDDIGHVPTTIYLVLPGMRIATHARWLRLFVYQLLAALERKPLPVDPVNGKFPLRLVLEEFAALGRMQAVETAAGYMAGAGVQLWAVLQDLTQIKTHYPESWETFLGNAGIINAFNVVDATTTKYISEMLGTTTILERRYTRISTSRIAEGDPGHETTPRTIPLLEPAEITLHFARETNRQIVLVPGRPPIYMQRLPYGFSL